MRQTDFSATPEIFRPLVPIASAVLAGIGAGVSSPGHVTLAAGGGFLAASWLIRCIFGRRRALWSPLLFCGLCGYLAVQPWLVETLPGDHVSRHIDSRVWQIQGRIVEPPREKDGRWRWVLAISQIRRSGQLHAVCGRVLVTGRGDLSSLARGDTIRFDGRLRAIRNFANPGGFDYRRFLALQAIRVRTYARDGTIDILPTPGHGRWLRRLDLLRHRLATQLELVLGGFPGSTRALLRALLLGEQHRIDDRLRDGFNRAGVGHVLAISGLHIGMVAALVFVPLRWGLVLIPWVRRHGWTRRGAALASLTVVIGYGLLAGLSPSTQRAMIMVAVFLGRYWSGRYHDWLNALALAALVILVMHPPALMRISFQLSFLSVSALILGLGRGARQSPETGGGIWRRLGRKSAGMLKVSLLAIAGTLPLVLYYFNQASNVGLFVNLLVVPVVGFLVVPVGLLGTAAAIFSSHAAWPCWHLSAWAMEGVRRLVEWVARWPWSAFRSVTPSGPEILLYYGTAAVLLWYRRLPRRKVVLAALLILWACDGGYWYHQRFGGTDLRATVLDVGQGSANLLRLPQGFVALVDGGGFSNNRYFDVGARIIAPLLWRNKIKTVDLVVLTHANSDHLNGLLYILDQFHVRTVWANGEAAETQSYHRWRQLIRRRGIACPPFEQLPVRSDIHGATMEILAPPKDFLLDRSSWRDLNNNSLVLRVEYKGVSLLLGGDMAAEAEADLLHRHAPGALHSTILLAPHHGSGRSSTPALLRVVRPRETVISCGWQNRFGFPHPDVIRRLSRINSRVWCTADVGAVQIVVDAQGRYSMTASR